jgi:hypothetical protein
MRTPAPIKFLIIVTTDGGESYQLLNTGRLHIAHELFLVVVACKAFCTSGTVEVDFRVVATARVVANVPEPPNMDSPYRRGDVGAGRAVQVVWVDVAFHGFLELI